MKRYILVADIHSNLPALEAIMEDAQSLHPDGCISLGDQVNLGPCPRQVMDMLYAADAICLQGNHERYVLGVLDGDPAYDGANFDPVRFTASELTRRDVTLPELVSMPPVTFCHSLPENDHFPIYLPERSVPYLRGRTKDDHPLIICGHGHDATYYSLPGLQIYSLSSCGCMNAGVAGVVSYMVLYLEEDAAVLRRRDVRFDCTRVRKLFEQSRLREMTPVMARIACMQMMENREYIVRFTRFAAEFARETGHSSITQDVMAAADARFHWPDGKTTAEFWR